MDPGLKQLGRRVAESQEPVLRSFDLEMQRSRFLLHALVTPGVRSRVVGRATLVCAAAALLLALWWGRSPSLRFEVAGVPGREGEWMAAPGDRGLPLRFSDGSHVVLRAGARARVVDSSERGARVVLERGTLRMSIMHRPETRWRVDAGPFEVHVVGTAFDVTWQNERFTLELREGAVRVVGPAPLGLRHVVAGERLDIDLGGEPKASRAQTTPLPVRLPQVTELVAKPPRIQSARRSPDFRKLSARGEYARAWKALTQGGLDPIRANAEAADLMLIADVARFTNHPEEAEAALLTLRRRFATHPLARQAAFALGRLAFDQRADLGEAARWFRTYLDAGAEPAFAQEAAGRLIECHVRRGDAGAAEAAAREYLARFARGPHATLAQGVIDGTNEVVGEDR